LKGTFLRLAFLHNKSGFHGGISREG